MKELSKNPSVCCVMCTYGRFETVRQSISMFLHQDYKNKKLVVFNTAEEPLNPDTYLHSLNNVVFVNQPLKADGTPYKSLGDVRTASLAHARGDIYICWDDDDLFLPWHISRGVEKLKASGKAAWKSDVSYWSRDGGKTFNEVMGNSMEASVLAHMDVVQEHAFSLGRSGAEHVDGGWYSWCNDNDELSIENISPWEGYGYMWGDPLCGDKTSGHIGDPDNFERHKRESTDFGKGRLLTAKSFDGIESFLRSTYTMWVQSDHESVTSRNSFSEESLGDLRDLIRSQYEKYRMPFPAEFEPSPTVNVSAPESEDFVDNFWEWFESDAYPRLKKHITAILREST